MMDRAARRRRLAALDALRDARPAFFDREWDRLIATGDGYFGDWLADDAEFAFTGETSASDALSAYRAQLER